MEQFINKYKCISYKTDTRKVDFCNLRYSSSNGILFNNTAYQYKLIGIIGDTLVIIGNEHTLILRLIKIPHGYTEQIYAKQLDFVDNSQFNSTIVKHQEYTMGNTMGLMGVIGLTIDLVFVITVSQRGSRYYFNLQGLEMQDTNYDTLHLISVLSQNPELLQSLRKTLKRDKTIRITLVDDVYNTMGNLFILEEELTGVMVTQGVF